MLLSDFIKIVSTSWIKVLSFFGIWFVVWLPIAFFLSRLIDWQPKKPLMPKQKLILLASLYLIAPGVIVWKASTESLSSADFGLNLTSSNWYYILLGLALSIGSLILVFSLESASNLITWHWQNFQQLPSLLLPILSLSLLISLVEETIFRGYVFVTLLRDNSFWVAIVASSMIFATLHLVWERKQTLPQIPGLWLMGVVLVGARVLTDNSIYLALGLHAGWIWGLTCIDSADLLTYRHSDHWFSGIKQQPLAGTSGILCLLITGIFIWGVRNILGAS
ncbi:MAG: CPBP family intramembrane glutamic endopeptidase [Cyanobacteria bacterium J06621_12]